MLTRRLPLPCAVFALFVLGCKPPDPPGDLVGAYHIEGELTENTCGSDALPAADSLNFDVEIRKDAQGRGLWVRATPPPRSGQLDDDGSFAFNVQTTYDVPQTAADPAEATFDRDPASLIDPEAIDKLDMASMKTCNLVVDERIEGSMLRAAADAGIALGDAGSSEAGTDLRADNEIGIRATSGSDCGRVLNAQGGPFLELPCHAHYDLTGTLAGP